MNSSALGFDLQDWKTRIERGRQDLGQGQIESAAFAALIDELVSGLGRAAGWDRPGRALIAMGGYGRAEMAPQSDVDLLFLIRRNGDSGSFDEVLYPLWDLGLDVGHALRTPADCASMANSDLTAATAFLDARLLIGDRDLLQRAQKKAGIRPGGSRETRGWVTKIMEDVAERRIRFGEISHLLEPHVKEGRGGLRDLQGCRWILRCLGKDNMEEIHISASNEELDAAVKFINRTRNVLHTVAGRKTDHLTFEYHREVAARVLPGVELHEFFAELHRASHRIMATWEAVAAFAQQTLLPKRTRSLLSQPLKSSHLIREQILTWTREGGDLPEELRHTFISGDEKTTREAVISSAARILRSRLPLAPLLFELQALERLDLFATELAKVIHQVHYDARHAFTTGVHSIETLRAFEDLWLGNLETREPHLTRIVGAVLNPGVVRVAALCHDLGKVSGTSDHARAGASIARTMALRLDFTEDEAEETARLVEHHHVIPRIAFGEDLEDPAAWEGARAAAGNNSALDALVSLTFADLIATNPSSWAGVWSDWKRDLLLHLHARARDETLGLPGRETRFRAAVEEVATELDLPDFGDIWGAIPTREADQVPPDLLAHLLALTRDFDTQPAHWHVESQRGGTTEILGAVSPLPRVLSSSTATLTQLGLNILAFQVHTWADGTTHLWFRVASPSSPLVPEQLAQRLNAGLVGTKGPNSTTMPTLVNRRAGAVPVETRVHVAAGENPFYTVLEVRCRDRRGLIRDLALLFENLGLTVEHALVTTHGPMALDIFHLKDIFGGRVDGETKLANLLAGVEEVAQQVET